MSTIDSTQALETVRCLGCGEEIQFEPSLLGRVVNCPGCDCLTRLTSANPPAAPVALYRAPQSATPSANSAPPATAPIHAVGSVKKTKCLNCGLPMSYDSQDAGRRIKCPSCSLPVTLPGGAALAVFPPPIPQGHLRAQLVPQMGYGQPLPMSVAVEMAEMETESRREDLEQKRQRFEWQKDARDQTAVIGLGINGITVAFVLSALLFHQDVRRYAESVLVLAVLGALAGSVCSVVGAFTKSDHQWAGQIGVGVGLFLIFLIPAGWSLLK